MFLPRNRTRTLAQPEPEPKAFSLQKTQISEASEWRTRTFSRGKKTLTARRWPKALTQELSPYIYLCISHWPKSRATPCLRRKYKKKKKLAWGGVRWNNGTQQLSKHLILAAVQWRSNCDRCKLLNLCLSLRVPLAPVLGHTHTQTEVHSLIHSGASFFPGFSCCHLFSCCVFFCCCCCFVPKFYWSASELSLFEFSCCPGEFFHVLSLKYPQWLRPYKSSFLDKMAQHVNRY